MDQSTHLIGDNPFLRYAASSKKEKTILIKVQINAFIFNIKKNSLETIS